MTYEEASNVLKKAFDPTRNTIKNSLQLLDALSLAIKALENQIPKKANGGTHVGYCPDCKNIVFADQKFCPQCGKALDWGIEK